MVTNTKAITVSLNTSLKDVLLNMNKSGERIVLVADENNRFFGTITDGDVRRWLLNNELSKGLARQVANEKAIVTLWNTPENKIKELFNKNDIDQLPLLNEKREIVGLVKKNSIYSINKNVALCIMAGGKGTRLHPVTKSTPKPLVQVNGISLLEHLILKAKSEGLKDVFISVNYLSDQVIDFIKKRKNFGLNIKYLKEDKFLGTAGSLALLKNEKKYDHYLVTNCDVFLETPFCEIIDFHLAMGSAATMCATKHIIKNEFGVIQMDGISLTGFEEKPEYVSYVNAGVYVLTQKVIQSIEFDKELDMPNLLMTCVNKQFQVNCFHIDRFWVDVGREKDLIKLEEHLR